MPPSLELLIPVFALASWTALILLLVAYRRLSAGFALRIPPREYALGESALVPPAATQANRNYMNLLELPVLFYVACLIGYASHVSSAHMVTLAWVYVGLRVVHSLIHVTYNQVMHRFAAFVASNFALIGLWVLLARALFATASQ